MHVYDHINWWQSPQLKLGHANDQGYQLNYLDNLFVLGCAALPICFLHAPPFILQSTPLHI